MIVYGVNAVKEALKNNQNIEKIYIDFNRVKKEKYKEIIDLANLLKIPLQKTKKSYIDKLTKTSKNQGICAIISKINFIDYRKLIENIAKKKSYGLILDSITDPQNLGLIIRSLVAFKGEGLILNKKNSPPINEIVIKSSSGSIFHTNISKVENFENVIKVAKSLKLKIYALETGGKDIRKFKINLPALFIVGSEGKGVSKELIKCSDEILTIPMDDKIPSLNVACATSILCWEVFKNF